MFPHPHPGDVHLGLGDVHFGSAGTRIRTLLGSCIAIAVWHPVARVGGMCHFVLPGRRPHRDRDRGDRPGWFAADAMDHLLDAIGRHGSDPREFTAKVFGGGHQFGGTGAAAGIDVPQRNVEAAHRVVAHAGLRVVASHLGGSGHRQVLLDVGSGEIWLRHEGTGGHVHRAAHEHGRHVTTAEGRR